MVNVATSLAILLSLKTMECLLYTDSNKIPGQPVHMDCIWRVINDNKCRIYRHLRHFQGIMNDKSSQFSIMNDIVNDSFASKPDDLSLVYT